MLSAAVEVDRLLPTVSTRSKPGCFASREGEEDEGGRAFSSFSTTEEGRGCRAKGLRRGIVAVLVCLLEVLMT